MQNLVQKTLASAAVTKFVDALTEKNSLIVEGLWESPKAILTHAAFRQMERSVLFLAQGTNQCDLIYDNLINFVPNQVLLFPSWETLPHEETQPHPEIVSDRFNVLLRCIEARKTGQPLILIMDIQSLMQKVLLPETFASMMVSVKVGEQVDMELVLKKIIAAGYEPESMIDSKGQFARRGGIVDIFPVNEDFPVRIEFFGDEVDSIRTFDPATQRSVGKKEKVLIAPFNEPKLYQKYRSKLTTITDYLALDTMVFYDDQADIEARAEEIETQIPAHAHQYLLLKEINQIVEDRKKVYFHELAVVGQERLSDEYVDVVIQPPATMAGAQAISIENGGEQIEYFKHLPGWLEQDIEIYFVCNNTGELDRLKMVFNEHDIAITDNMSFVTGSLSSGFFLPDMNLLVVCDREIFHRYKVKRQARRFKGSAPIHDFAELTNGDYVVHAEYGIGRYRGLTTLQNQPEHREFMAIEYRDDAKLYVPMAQANMVTKYIGADKSRPAIDELGSSRWSRVKKRTEKAVMEYASELLELYAARESMEGTRFSPDTLWQKEFEDAFLYTETDDQVQAIEKVKEDMERARPMDRLICGDVGYGKTEVAIRAAFKAAMDAKQVAVLVPTTILAQQHYQTFCERMADYPVTIEMLSRFRTRGQQQKILKAFNEGKIDILIGTHRLVQPDVKPKDLGLIIIDEEQRFGVKHKEQLKQLRKLVDVMTMTATPIPRTLYMSLIGARDMSNIDTPPMDRLPVKTVLAEFNENVIKQAIQRERARGGQVYFLHNRVKTIEAMTEYLQRLAPDSVIVYAHGQMHERQLESIMNKFIEGKIDVLVCTTIVESGLDIQNANTIIIDNAHRFGLADLYQLRGRVGRWKHQAYAYLLVPQDREVLQIARKRLRAVIESQGYGAGFKIAMHDLEIRGAGNILGTKQSGHIAAIGFRLYCNLLKRAIGRLKGHEVPDYTETKIKIDIEASLPQYYIPDHRQRIDMYRRLGDIVSEEQVKEVTEELRDRFGELPDEVQYLLGIVDLRVWAQKKNITSIEISGRKIIAIRGKRRITDNGRFPRVTSDDPLAQIFEAKYHLEKLLS